MVSMRIDRQALHFSMKLTYTQVLYSVVYWLIFSLHTCNMWADVQKINWWETGSVMYEAD